MSFKPTYLVHTHYGNSSEPIDITSRVISGSWSRGIDPPYGGATFTFKCAYSEKGTLVNTGNWVTIHDPAGVAYDMFYVSTVTYRLMVADNGAISFAATVTCITWMELLGSVQFYVALGSVESTGTMFAIDDWANIINIGANNNYYTPATTSLGQALSAIFKAAVRIELPSSLGGETLGDAIRVVYDENTAKLYAPALAKTIDPVDGFTGFYKNLPLEFYTATVLETLNKAFVGSPLLVEMIPYMVYGDLGQEEKKPKLLDRLKCRPILLYRFRPWREEPLSQAATTWQDFVFYNDNANAPRPRADVLQKLEEYQRDAVANQAQYLSGRYNKVTWSVASAKTIPFEMVRAFEETQSDGDRVNITTVRISLDGKTGAEADPYIGLPIVNRHGVRNHGARVMRPEWTFLPLDLNSKDSISQFRAIAAQAMQWHVNGHLLGKGTLVISPLDAVYLDSGYSSAEGNLSRYLHLWSGDIILIQFKGTTSPYTAYATEVQHEWSVTRTGAISLKCTVSFIRGSHMSDRLSRLPKVPIDAGKVRPAIPTSGSVQRQGTVSSTDRQKGTSPTPTNSILADGKDIPLVGGGTITRWLVDIGGNIPPTLLPNRVNKTPGGSGTFTQPQNNRGLPIKSVIVHYDDGGFGSNARRLRDFFQRKLDGYPTTQPVGTHFIIDPDGGMMQIYDAAWMAFHAEIANAYSVGIDLIVPYTLSYGKADEIKAQNPAHPWPVISQTWVGVNPSGSYGPRRRNFYGPTERQINSLIVLLRTLKTLGFAMTHPRETNSNTEIRRFSPERAKELLVAGGVFHHLQISQNRQDCFGLDLSDVVGRV